MNTFTLVIQDVTHAETIEGVSSFVGEDKSGSFGILANHARMMTSLVMGLARYRTGNGAWQYLAQPGALLYFQNNLLTISTRHYFRHENYMQISNFLQQKLLAEEEQLHTIKHSLQHMEQEILKHIWELRRQEGPA
ncbi:MAG: F0F1 ATP synthase subunit epsilon [Gammaproteobacteria bacterium]|jgi:F-type H+-transporting ATPase subunit epsilon|nr:F0F1 ATP synthase subunit epsilon [Gammaproteobacteria bacterium]